MDEQDLARTPVVVYGCNLLLAGTAYFLLELAILRCEGEDGVLRAAVGRDAKGKLSLVVYLVGIAAALLVSVWVGLACYVAVALIWLVPDRRMEGFVAEHGTGT